MTVNLATGSLRVAKKIKSTYHFNITCISTVIHIIFYHAAHINIMSCSGNFIGQCYQYVKVKSGKMITL